MQLQEVAVEGVVVEGLGVGAVELVENECLLLAGVFEEVV